MIARFINSKGEVNCGIVLNHDPDGMVEVMWDEFTQLLERLGARNPLSEFARKSLVKHVSWVRVETPRPYGATMELLPIHTPVMWTDEELEKLQATLAKTAIVALAL